MSTAASPPAAPQAPRLLDQVRHAALARFGRSEPSQRYVDWTRRFILFHGKRHPRELGRTEVGRFLEHVAQTEKDPLRCLEEAHEALTFLYHDLLHLAIGELPFPEPPRLLDRMRRALRAGHYSAETEVCYVAWGTQDPSDSVCIVNTVIALWHNPLRKGRPLDRMIAPAVCPPVECAVP